MLRLEPSPPPEGNFGRLLISNSSSRSARHAEVTALLTHNETKTRPGCRLFNSLPACLNNGVQCILPLNAQSAGVLRSSLPDRLHRLLGPGRRHVLADYGVNRPTWCAYPKMMPNLTAATSGASISAFVPPNFWPLLQSPTSQLWLSPTFHGSSWIKSYELCCKRYL
jgi:hypothetical protein